MVINYVANVMMNGVCCMHQMQQQEEERKQEYHEALRRAMTVEWQRHMLMERELEEQRLRAQGGMAETIREAEERRRRLMMAKQNATAAAAGPAASSISSHNHGTIGIPAVPLTVNDNLSLSDRLARVSSGTSCKTAMDGRSTISTSSLLDNEDDDDEEECEDAEGEFENVDL